MIKIFLTSYQSEPLEVDVWVELLQKQEKIYVRPSGKRRRRETRQGDREGRYIRKWVRSGLSVAVILRLVNDEEEGAEG